MTSKGFVLRSAFPSLNPSKPPPERSGYRMCLRFGPFEMEMVEGKLHIDTPLDKVVHHGGRLTAVQTSEVDMLSTNVTPHNPSLTASNFQQTCGFCGCVFRVDITWQTSYSHKGNQDTQTYACPECRRECRIRTSTAPRLTVISRRTDGRTEAYPNT